MMTRIHTRYVAALLAGLLGSSSLATTAAQVQRYDDLPSFQAAASGAGLSFLGVEDFEESLVAPGGVFFLPNFIGTVPNFAFPSGLALPNLDVVSNDLAGNPSVVVPGGGLVLLGQGFLGGNSELVGARVLDDSTDLLLLGGDETAVGFHVLTQTGPAVKLTVFDTANTQIFQTVVSANTTYGTFVGFVSSAPIGRINVNDELLGGELVDDIHVYSAGATPWKDLGNGLPGTAGTPLLAGTGPLSAGSANQIDLTNALAAGTTNLVWGFSLINLPFKGGVIGPSIDILLSGLPLDASGSLTIPFVWPAGVPAGTQFWLQHWIADPAGPSGFAASNTLQGEAQ